LVSIWKGQNWLLTKIETKLNKNHEYRDQIEYKTLTLLCCSLLLDWHVDI